MSSEWIEGMCNETTGFLFRHQCNQNPLTRCQTCDKPICEEHERPLDGMILCVTCNRAETRRRGLKGGRRRAYDDDPYYYGGTYYPGYGYYHGSRHLTDSSPHDHASAKFDPNDLNAGDAESLKNEGDEDFEADMSES
jgi:hypothetical protein